MINKCKRKTKYLTKYKLGQFFYQKNEKQCYTFSNTFFLHEKFKIL